MRKIDIPTLLTAMATLGITAPAIGCFTESEPLDGPTTVVVGEEDDGKRDTATGERSATVQGFTITMNAHAIVGASGGVQTVVMKGTASRTITNVFSYVPDDGFGTATLTGTKTFEILLDEPHEINTLLSGMPILVVIDTLTGAVRHFDAQVTLQPRFARFDGTTRIIVDPVIRPVYVADPVDNLRYRGRFTTTSSHTSPEVTAFDAGDPVTITQRGPLETTFDWQFPAFSLAYDPPTDPMTMRATFTTNPPVGTKHAGIDLKVVKLGLTTDDPYLTWPAPACTPTVAACYVDHLDDGDFGSCGDYRQVAPCRYADLCELTGGDPVTLTPIETDPLDSAIAAFNTGCDRGFTWCELTGAQAYTLPECPDEEITPELIFSLVADQNWPDDTYGDYVDNTGLNGSLFFSNGYSNGGPGLRTAVDSLAGASTAEGWIGVSEYPCHNCHNWYERTIVYYAATHTVVVLDGFYGYDS